MLGGLVSYSLSKASLSSSERVTELLLEDFFALGAGVRA
jgi:hypothetical protein